MLGNAHVLWKPSKRRDIEVAPVIPSVALLRALFPGAFPFRCTWHRKCHGASTGLHNSWDVASNVYAGDPALVVCRAFLNVPPPGGGAPAFSGQKGDWLGKGCWLTPPHRPLINLLTKEW